MAKKHIFISDVHLGAGRFSPESQDREIYPNDWDWLSAEETANFEQFLRFLREDYTDQIREIVLMGDIFDNWVFPHDMVPPTMDELILAEKNIRVVEELRKLSENLPVFYIPGNHDMHATAPVIERHFPKMTYCPTQFIDGRLLAEHGHRYALFNAPARFSNNFMGLPLGYFISRIEATRKAVTGAQTRSYHTYIDDFIEMAGRPTLPQCVLEAVIEEADLSEDLEFKYKRPNGGVQTVSAMEVKAIYRDIYNDWSDQVISRHRAVFAEMDMMGPVADRLCKDGKHHIVILGHSHKCEIDKDTWFVADRIYANTGFWCGTHCTFVETEKTANRHRVRTVRWEGDGQLVKGRAYDI